MWDSSEGKGYHELAMEINKVIYRITGNAQMQDGYFLAI